MADLDRKHYYIDFCGLCGLGLFFLGYVIFYSSFAELNIRFPFLNFPIFVGEILLFVCLLLFLAKCGKNPPRLTNWHYLILGYFIFVLSKAAYGYLTWGPLALRHAALLYYPVFAVFGYAFFRKDFFGGRKALLLFLFICIILVGRHDEYWVLTLTFLGIILIKSFSDKTIRPLMFLGLLILIPYKEFFLTSRMMILSNFLSGLYLAIVLPIILNVNKKFKLGLAVLIGGVVILGMLKMADRGAVKSIVAFTKMAEVVKTCDAYIEANGEHFKMEEREEVKLYNPNGPARGDTQISITNDKKTTETTEGQARAELKKIIVKDVKEKVESFSLGQIDQGTQAEVKREIKAILDMQLPKEMQESSKTLLIKDENQVTDVEAVKREIEPVPVAVVQAAQEHSVDLVKAEISQVKDEIQESVVGEREKETESALAVPKLEAMVKPSTDSVKTDVEAIQGGVQENDVIQTKMQVESDPIVVVPETLKSSEGQESVVEGAKGKIEPVFAVPVTAEAQGHAEGFNNAEMLPIRQKADETQESGANDGAEDVVPVIVTPASDVTQEPEAELVETAKIAVQDKVQGSGVEEASIIIRETLLKQIGQEIGAISVENMSNGEKQKYAAVIDDVKKEMQAAFTEQAKKNISVVPVKASPTGWVDNNNAVFRLLIWRDMFRDLIKEKPILGFSFGKPLRSISLEILGWGASEWARDGWVAAHNSYFDIIYRTGMIGVLFIWAIFFMLFQMIRRFVQLKSVVGVLLCGIIINWFIAANFLVIFELPYTAIPIWTIYGMTFAYCYKSREIDYREKTVS